MPSGPWAPPPAPLPDAADMRADWAHSRCDVAEWDRQLGLVLTALERSGRAADAIVVVTTDHGVPFPAMPCNPTMHGTGVSLVLRGPVPLPPGAVTTSVDERDPDRAVTHRG